MDMLDLEDRDVTPVSYLIGDLGAESIDLLELAGALRTRLNIKVEESDIFLMGVRGGVRGRLQPGECPFLPAERIYAIECDNSGGPVVQVQDLVSYVAWQLGKAEKPPLPTSDKRPGKID